MRLLAVALALLVLTPLAGAATRFTAVGTYTISGGALTEDACTSADLQGITSTCSFVPVDALGKEFRLTANGAVALSGLKLCQYDATAAQLGCVGGDPTEKSKSLSGLFETDATHFSVTTMAGAKVTWYLSTL